MEDLIQGARLGFARLLQTYDPRRGASVMTYALWGALAGAGEEAAKGGVVRMSHAARKKMREARRNGVDLTDPRALVRAGLARSEADAQAMVAASLHHYSLDGPSLDAPSPGGGDETSTLGDRLADEATPVDEQIARAELHRLAVEVLLKVKPLAREVVLRHTLGDESCRQIGQSHGRCGENMRQIEARALRTMRRELRRML